MEIDLFGNPKMEGQQKESAKTEKTSFRDVTTQFMQGIEGAIQPIDCIKVVPGTKVKGHYKINIKLRNPSVRPLKNSMKFRVHAYMCYNRDAWKYWKAYISQGTSGSNGLQVPCIDGYMSNKDTNNGMVVTLDRGDTANVLDTFTPNSLANCLGIPWRNYTTEMKLKNTNHSNTLTLISDNRFCFRPTVIKALGLRNGNVEVLEQNTINEWRDDDLNKPDLINALPFVHCQKIYRKYYMNYELENVNGKLNKAWYNELEEPLWLTKRTTASDPYVNTICARWKDYCTWGDDKDNFMLNYLYKSYGHVWPLGKDETMWLNRGHKEGITLGAVIPFQEVPRNANNQNPENYEYPYLNSLKFRQITPDYLNSGSPYPNLMRDGVEPITDKDLTKVLYKGDITTAQSLNITSTGKLAQATGGTVTTGEPSGPLTDNTINTLKEMLGITMSDLRKMTVLTRFKEKMSKVSQLDMYNGIIETSFGTTPEQDTHEPIYIGGFAGNLNTYGQTSTNNEYNESTPTGEIGRGEVTIEGDIPEFYANDHGYVIVMLSSEINTILPHHLDRAWKTVNFEQEYFPEWNQLEPQATKLTEKTLKIDPQNGESKDDVIYNYNDRYIEYKTRLSNLLGFGQTREFVWDNMQYITMSESFEKGKFNVLANTLHPEMIDNSPMTVKTEPMFDYDILRDVTKIAPFPYKATPKEL